MDFPQFDLLPSELKYLIFSFDTELIHKSQMINHELKDLLYPLYLRRPISQKELCEYIRDGNKTFGHIGGSDRYYKSYMYVYRNVYDWENHEYKLLYQKKRHDFCYLAIY